MATPGESGVHQTTGTVAWLDSTEVLSTLDSTALRRDFERLSVDDLAALASFPAEPHAVITRVTAATYCLLLTLAPEHTTLTLAAPPWALLRLQLLADTVAVWRKLRKRVWQLEAGIKTLAGAQVRFACNELVPFLLPLNTHKTQIRRVDSCSWHLERIAQVSTIAASLGAWVALCLRCCLLPRFCYGTTACISSILANGGFIPGQLHTSDSIARPPLNASQPQLWRAEDPVATNARSNTPTRLQPASRRMGLKIGSRFLLFHARLAEHPSVGHASSPTESIGEWSVFSLDAKRQHGSAALPPPTSPLLSALSVHSAWWKPLHAIEVPAAANSQWLTMHRVPPLAQRALLIQLGLQSHLFKRPMQPVPYANIPQLAAPHFALKFAVSRAASTPKKERQLSLLAIGNALVALETTVIELRRQLSISIVSCLPSEYNSDTSASFRFLHRGSLLTQSQERHLAAVTLLPFALVVFVDRSDAMAPAKALRCLGHRSRLWNFHRDISHALSNARAPDDLPQLDNSPSLATQCFVMRQPLASNSATTSIGTSTASVIVEFFTHWRAFVGFQQLQDSSVLFQIHSHSPKKPKRSPRKHRLDYAREGDDNPECSSDDRDDGPQDSQEPPLPRQRFNGKRDFLFPLYALVDITAPTTAVLKTPFPQDLQQALLWSSRLAIANDDHVIHITRADVAATEYNEFGVLLSIFELGFQRDESCRLESLLTLCGAYAWLVLPLKPRTTRTSPLPPPGWLQSIYRFVQHPTHDFETLTRQQLGHFRVPLSVQFADKAIESAFWSRGIDWIPSLDATDLHTTLLRRVFDALCHSHPPAFGVDSVKFSKLLYEAGVQPTLLTIGDAAFLFASNLSFGSTYEMDYDGFIHALDWIAQHFYSGVNDGKNLRKSPSKTNNAMRSPSKRQLPSKHTTRSQPLSPLRRFYFETLIHLTSLQPVWRDLVNSWRRERKRQLLEIFALEYCAATRIRASWKRFITWRTYLRILQRMKEERLAATKLQSLVRGRRAFLQYHRQRNAAIRLQLRLQARWELRRLRAERAAYIERMRVRMVHWMRWQLFTLRVWRRENPEKAARRARIREKRERRLLVAVFPLETRLLRFTLYRAKPDENLEAVGDIPAAPSESVITVNGEQTAVSDGFDLEVLDATWSWGQVFHISQQDVDRFHAEENDRMELQRRLELTLTSTDAEVPSVNTFTALPHPETDESGEDERSTKNLRESVAHPTSAANVALLALARRLFVQEDMQRRPEVLRCYSNPVSTSLGKLVFKGALSSRDDCHLVHSKRVQHHVVRVLQWADAFKLMVYTPATSFNVRFDLPASFLLRILRFSQFQSMSLNPPSNENQTHSGDCRVDAEDERDSHHQLRRIMTGQHRVLALRHVLSYLLHYGVRIPTYDMMPHIVAERERQRNQREAEQRVATLENEERLIVRIQSRVRQIVARQVRLQLAQKLYTKEFDRELNHFVYVRLHPNSPDLRRVRFTLKPQSLFDQDVPLPPDDWRPVQYAYDDGTRFFNPRRGLYSKFNATLAARRIQRWFRGVRWAGINDWGLRDVAQALRYHSDVHAPTSFGDPAELENLKRHALQLHVLEHQHNAACAAYEAALKVSPEDLHALVGLATLLAISCRYPVARSWTRAKAFLQQARELAGTGLAAALLDMEEKGFRWALFLQPESSLAIANLAVFSQCVHHDLDKAELLYRRALDIDPANDLVLTNYRRLLAERTPDGAYAFAGPGKIALARSTELRRCGENSQWREMTDPAAHTPSSQRFFQELATGVCSWELPNS